MFFTYMGVSEAVEIFFENPGLTSDPERTGRSYCVI